METFEPEYNDKKDMIHFHKVNIFGDEGVGKTNFISFLSKFQDFELKREMEPISYGNSVDKDDSLIVEKIERVIIKTEDGSINLNIYETNLNKYDYIKMNLDTLLVQTELIIMMWDSSDPDTFNNINNLSNIIISGMKNSEYRDAPIIIIQNKTDLELESSVDSRVKNEIEEKINQIKNDYPNILIKKISLVDKNEDNYYDLLLDFERKLKIGEVKKNSNEVIDLVKFKYPFKNNKNLENNNNINIALLGAPATGKTSFIYALKETKMDNIAPTTELDNFQIKSEVDNENINISITDTIGQERYRSIVDNVYKKADGFLIFFDVTNKESFNEINYYLKKIEDNSNNKNKGIILLGNKIDDNSKRTIQKKFAKKKGEENGIKYFEISCLYGINILEVLNEITLVSYKNYKLKMYENNYINNNKDNSMRKSRKVNNENITTNTNINNINDDKPNKIINIHESKDINVDMPQEKNHEMSQINLNRNSRNNNSNSKIIHNDKKRKCNCCGL